VVQATTCCGRFGRNHSKQPDRGAGGTRRRRTLIVETAGTGGQVNGLAGTTWGLQLGKPSRITPLFYGKKGVLNIERETKALREDPRKGGPDPHQLPRASIRTDGAHQPHRLDHLRTAYGMIEGFRTCAELYALLSALSGVPVRRGSQ